MVDRSALAPDQTRHREEGHRGDLGGDDRRGRNTRAGAAHEVEVLQALLAPRQSVADPGHQRHHRGDQASGEREPRRAAERRGSRPKTLACGAEAGLNHPDGGSCRHPESVIPKTARPRRSGRTPRESCSSPSAGPQIPTPRRRGPRPAARAPSLLRARGSRLRGRRGSGRQAFAESRAPSRRRPRRVRPGLFPPPATRSASPSLDQSLTHEAVGSPALPQQLDRSVASPRGRPRRGAAAPTRQRRSGPETRRRPGPRTRRSGEESAPRLRQEHLLVPVHDERAVAPSGRQAARRGVCRPAPTRPHWRRRPSGLRARSRDLAGPCRSRPGALGPRLPHRPRHDLSRRGASRPPHPPRLRAQPNVSGARWRWTGPRRRPLALVRLPDRLPPGPGGAGVPGPGGRSESGRRRPYAHAARRERAARRAFARPASPPRRRLRPSRR